jgi:hypothetical protein
VAGRPTRRGNGRQRLYSRREGSVLTNGRTTLAPRGNAQPDNTDRTAGRGVVVRRRGARGALGMRAGMGKGRPRRAGPRAVCARAPRRRGAGAGRRSRRACGVSQPAAASQCPTLNALNSKKLNKSAQSGQKESCRSHYPLQLSQRPYGVFLHGFCTKCCQTLNVTMFR